METIIHEIPFKGFTDPFSMSENGSQVTEREKARKRGRGRTGEREKGGGRTGVRRNERHSR
jgi:hypothetical protein